MFNKDYSQYLRNNINQNQLESRFIHNNQNVVNTNNLFPSVNPLNQNQIVNNNIRNDFDQVNILNLMRNMSLESPNFSINNFQSLGQPLRPFVQSREVGDPLNSQLHKLLNPEGNQQYNNILTQNPYDLGINNNLNNINNNFGHQGNINNNKLNQINLGNNLYHNINNDENNLSNLLNMNKIHNISPEQLYYLKNKEKLDQTVLQLNNNNNLIQNIVNNYYNQYDRPDDSYLNYNDILNIHRLGGTNNFVNNIQNINRMLKVNEFKNNFNNNNELQAPNNINLQNLNPSRTQNLNIQFNTNKKKKNKKKKEK